jgi:hypothetical protein
MTEGTRKEFNLDQFLHPAKAFGSPSQVVNDPDMTLAEKRAVLASWASDACAVEASPELREPSPGHTVKYDEIMEALRALDAQVDRRTDYGKLVSRAQRAKDLFWKNRGVLRTEGRTQ